MFLSFGETFETAPHHGRTSDEVLGTHRLGKSVAGSTSAMKVLISLGLPPVCRIGRRLR
jgi:hypothetical protein